jgi:hypothetical protein
MQFRKTTTISIPDSARSIFEEIEKIRPKHMSFSLFLATILDDHLRNNKEGKPSKGRKNTPILFTNIQNWQDHVVKLNTKDFKELQYKLNQIGNLIDIEVSKRL